MQIWIHDSKMRKITALNNDIPDMLSYSNSAWHPYLDQATSTFDFTIPKFSNGELHEDIKLINDECFVSFYVNGSYQVFYIATLQEDDFNIQLTCNNTNLEYALEYANPFNSSSAQSIEWYLNHMDLLSFAAVEIGINEVSDRKRTLTFDSQETKMNRLQSLMSNFDAEFEFKTELNRDGTYKRIAINIYQKDGIGTDRKDVVLYYSNGLKGVQVSSDKTQMFNAAVFTGKDGLSLADVEISEKNADGIEEFYSRKGSDYVFAPLSRERYPSTMQPGNADNWIRKDFTTEYENVNDLKAYALRTLKQYAYPLVTYTASVQSGFVSHYTDLKLGDTIRIIDKNFAGGLALEARVSEMIISFDNPANNSFVFTNYRKLDNKPSSALQTRIEQAIESRLSYRIELATTGGVTFKNNEGETIIKPSLYKGNLPWTKDVTWHWTLNGVVTDGVQYRIQARNITDTAVLTVDAFVGGNKVATTEITLTNVNDGLQGPQGPQGDEGPQGPQGDEGPQGPQGDTGNGIANTVVTYGLSMSDTTEPATWSSSVPTLVKGMYLWTRTVIIYTNGDSTTSYQISYIAKDADATAAIDKTKQELLEKLETVRDDSLAAVEEAKQQLTTVADDLSKAKTDFQNAVSEVDTKATNLKSDVSNLNTSLSNTAKALQTQGMTLANQAKELQTQASQLTAQAKAQETLTTRVENVETTANGTKTTVSELNKTVAQNGKDITSVSNRTKTVETGLTSAKTSISELQTSVSTAQTDLTNLTKRTKTVEDGLTGTKTNLSELTQTVSNDGKTIASLTSRTKTVEDSVSGLKTTMSSVQKDLTAVTTRTKTVEDDLAGTKTTLSQVKTTADSTSQKTATLETGLNGLNAKFSNLKIGGANLLLYSADPSKAPSGYYSLVSAHKTSETYNGSVVYRVWDIWGGLKVNLGILVDRGLLKVGDVLTYSVAMRAEQATPIKARLFIRYTNQSGAESPTDKMEIVNLTADWQYVSVTFTVTAKMLAENTKVTYLGWELTSSAESGKYVYYACNKIERGNLATDYSPNEADLEQRVAEYKQTADQNYASLQTTVQNLDDTVQHNKTVADQTAQGFTTRIESLETYKDGETTRANQYFELAKTETARQLTAERTAIAKDYVAKSTYTSDVTGIRNDLTATTTTANTTKTNLANYQASNDKAVANLQSNLQTANGNISSLQTKVEAVPGQITSAVSAVEGKIPTNVSTRNLILKSNDFANPHKQAGDSKTTVTSTDGYFVIKSTGYTANSWGGMSWNLSISEVKAGEEFSILMPVYIDSSIDLDSDVHFQLKNHPKNLTAYSYLIPKTQKDEWFNVAITFKTAKDVVFDTYPFYVYLVKNGLVRIKPPMIVRGNLIPSDYQPAFEDTESDITKLSSELTQTKDGMTLLATKTELNTAKSDLQSGINTATNKANAAQNTANSAQSTANSAQNKANSNAQTISTHTTQISALNTGLSAKVSQSDFNTLSGRVTTAENNITAKANELSSKITKVEGKIPTNIGTVNLIVKSTAQKGLRLAMGAGPFQDSKHELTDWIKVEPNKTYTLTTYEDVNEPDMWYSLAWYSTNNADYSGWIDRPTGAASAADLKGGKQYRSPANAKYAKVSYPTKYAKVKLERGNVASDWSPAIEDTKSDINAVSSELKQTTDAIKASVTSLDNSTVKSSSLTINTDGIVMKAGKSTTDVANAIGSYFAVNQNAINLFADKIKVKGNMIVSGAITGDKIAAGAITADKIVSSGITADVISGGVLKATNSAMQINLNSSNITFSKDASVIFTSSDNALKRVITGKPSQFIKMCDDVFASEIGELPNSTLTVIGSNSDRTESSDSAGFGGVRIWNGRSSTNTTSFVELVGNRVAIYGNKNRSPWLFDMSTTTSSLIPQNTNGIKHSLGRSDRRLHEVHANDVYIQGERVAMMLKDLALRIGYKGNNGWVDRIG